MQSEVFPTEVIFSTHFKKDVKRLHKKFKRIKSDITPLIDRITQGERPGDRIQNTPFIVLKVRVLNSDLNKGRRSGYRVIYNVQEPNLVTLVTIYAKSEQTDITPQQITKLIAGK
jgi:mRNA-degrading endonuclease RelE of RelBE toxin-antitoxin system